MSIKKGMAGLILLVMVLGYMMVITTSSTMLIQTESAGKAVRSGYKNALYAATGGLGVVMARLREDADTFAAIGARPYFTREDPDSDNHYADWDSTNHDFTTFTNLKNPGWLNVSSAFTLNTEIENENFLFTICTYPGDQTDPAEENFYYAKCQGKYIDPGSDREFRAQVWGRFVINAPSKLIALQSYGIMGVQSVDLNTSAGINDFWDWQKNF